MADGRAISLKKFKQMTKYIFLFSGLFSHIISFAQADKFANHNHSIKTFIQAYNQQDYRLMQKPIGFIGKVLISKKMLQKEFGSFHNKYGELSIDTIVYNSIYNGTAELKSKTYPQSRLFMTFNFNDSGKFEGFGFGYPTFVYKKNRETYSQISNAKRFQIIDSIIDAKSILPAPKNFNGCVLVSKNDSTYYKSCKGYADFDILQPLNDTSLFLLASCTKQFTAMAIMLLQEEKKLDISDKVSKYLPGFPYPDITIENLLTHTSGLPGYFSLIKKYGDKRDFITNKDVLNLLIDHKQKLRFIPGTRFEYSNTGYVILSLLIESASGTSYKEYVESKIFKPLNMHHSVVYNRRKEKNIIPNYALGYIYSDQLKKHILPDSMKQKQYVTYMDGITGDDGISSTTLELELWMKAFKNNTLIDAGSTKLMTSSHVLKNGTKTNYGFGLVVRSGDDIENMIYHTGSWPGYSTMMIELTERNERIIILANTDYDDLTFLADEIIYTLLK